MARHCFRNWWNRANGTGALRFQFDMCIVIEDAKAPSHCPPGLVTSHDIINCLGVCVYIYMFFYESLEDLWRCSVACRILRPRHLCLHSCNWRTEGDFFPLPFSIRSFLSAVSYFQLNVVIFVSIAIEE